MIEQYGFYHVKKYMVVTEYMSDKILSILKEKLGEDTVVKYVKPSNYRDIVDYLVQHEGNYVVLMGKINADFLNSLLTLCKQYMITNRVFSLDKETFEIKEF